MTHQQAVDSLAAERYLLDEMPELERYQFEAHYFECEQCAEDVKLGSLLREGVRADAASAPLVRAAAAAGRRPRGVAAVLPWAVAAALALGVGYQSLYLIPSLRRAAAPQAIAAVTLRGASRGPLPVVRVDPSQAFVLFSMDADMASAANGLVSYAISRADGEPVLSGEGRAPTGGLPLQLLVPGGSLRAPGEYVVTVRDAGQPAAAAIEYRFVVDAP